MQLRCGDLSLDLRKTCVMGILNITPDSFSDAGQFFDPQQAVARAHQMALEGATIIDVGAESTRPGAAQLTDQEELDRLIPVLEKIVGAVDAIISVDTRKPAVIETALKLGVSMINSVDALTTPGALSVLANNESLAAICLMHMKGEPMTMQQGEIRYNHIIEEIKATLQERAILCEQAGIQKDRIVIDPGFGFGKTPEHNCMITKQLASFGEFGYPVLYGCSRKSTLGHITSKPVDQRLGASIAGAVLAKINGANIVRVHDVAETVDAFKIIDAVENNDY